MKRIAWVLLFVFAGGCANTASRQREEDDHMLHRVREANPWGRCHVMYSVEWRGPVEWADIQAFAEAHTLSCKTQWPGGGTFPSYTLFGTNMATVTDETIRPLSSAIRQFVEKNHGTYDGWSFSYSPSDRPVTWP